jgi:hypothetical protein
VKAYHHEYIVEGPAPFPIDMLRYDGACPRTERDSHLIRDSIEGIGPRLKFQVVVSKVWERAWKPQVHRWESFGWKVLAHKSEAVSGGLSLPGRESGAA